MLAHDIYFGPGRKMQLSMIAVRRCQDEGHSMATPLKQYFICCRLALLLLLGLTSLSAAGEGPSFPCDKFKAGSIEDLVCRDNALSALDRKLSSVYAEAKRKAANEHPPVLKAEQRGWIKGRNDCWKSEDKYGCVREEYQRRIAELQARYRLVPTIGPVTFKCDGQNGGEVVVTFSSTEPPTLIAERGDNVSLMFLQRSASGAKYQGRNEILWEHHGEALVTWGYGAPEMRCRKSP
jgi:uncharacterized protein